MKVTMKSMLRKLEDLGFEDMRHNYILDRENAAMIADEYGFQIEDSSEESADVFAAPEKPELLQERPPVVTIMGHVDHGKTTILDYLRKSSIVSQEFGGITQHIGAFSVTTPQSKKKITFLDTPGHAAFLKMRERGAIITDIVILVVAAEDSVMPQTIEAIKHAKKSGVPMIVAINKCDKPGVDIDKVLSDLSANGVDIEDYGGDTQTVRVSGKTGMNMDKLEEAVITLSEMSEFKAEPKGVPAEGWIIESQVEKGMGHVATVLVRRGTLKPGDVVVAGQTYCRIKGMRDEHGKAVKAAGPSTPVRVWSWKDLPDSGDQLLQAKTEQIAKKAIDYRTAKLQEIQATRDMEIINEQRAEQLKEAERKEKIAEMKKEGLDTSALEEAEQESKSITCNYIVKSDVFGSAEAIKESIDGMGNDEVKAVVISTEAGAPTDSDLDMAKTFDATIFCFNLKVPKPIAARADREKIKIVEHNVIYRLIEEVTEELSSKLTPIVEHKTVGEVEIRNLFNVTINKQKVKVAGCKVSLGAIKMSSSIKVMRGDEEIFRGKLSSLKDVKENITEATKGKECGISFDKWTDFEIGDKIVAYEEILHKRYL
jgi:translation initiation factor IF-2